MSTVKVPAELLPVLRESLRSDLAMYGQSLDENSEQFDADCDKIERAITARRALAEDNDAYQSGAVHFAAIAAIRDGESRIANDALSVDEAELCVRQVRACERLVAEATA